MHGKLAFFFLFLCAAICQPSFAQRQGYVFEKNQADSLLIVARNDFQKNPHKALTAIELATQLAIRNEAQTTLANCYQMLADFYAKSSNKQAAYTFYRNAYKIDSTQNNQVSLLIDILGMTEMLLSDRNDAKVDELLGQATQILHSNKLDIQLKFQYNQLIAIRLEKKGQLQDAIALIEAFESTNEQVHLKKSLYLAKLYSLQTEFLRAEQILFDLAAKCQLKNDSFATAQTFIALADHFLQRQKVEPAWEFANQAHALSKEANFVFLLSHTNRLLAQLCTEKKAHEQALYYFSEREKIKDSLSNLFSESVLLVHEEWEHEALVKISNYKVRIYVVVALLLLLVLIVLTNIRFNRLKRKVLEKENKLIAKSLDEKKWLVSEMHHRVKNNLQIVSSLLNVQLKFLKDPSAVQAIRESRNRLMMMAMIHQKLYFQNDTEAFLDLNEYVKDVSNWLIKSIPNTEKKVQIQLDVQPLILDTETLIPLGLIINELTTNAFKYAFLHQATGQISLTIKKQEDILVLTFADNGVGMPEDFQEKEDASVGFLLIKSLSRKLGGDFFWKNENGAIFTIMINRYKIMG